MTPMVNDNVNRRINTTYVNDSTTWDYVYDENSNIQSITKNSTEILSFEYYTDINNDKLDRLSKVTFPVVNGVRNNISYDYNVANQVTKITNTVQNTVFDPINYSYDLAGSNTDISFPNDTACAFMYDDQSRLKNHMFVEVFGPIMSSIFPTEIMMSAEG